MKFFILTSLLSVFLMAQEAVNPKVYQSIGDEIYINAVNIEKLKSIKEFINDNNKIDIYLDDVKKTKKLGYQVESGSRSNIKLDYLEQLRKHKNVNEYFLKSAQSALHSALDTSNNSLFISIVNSGLIDTKFNRKMIMDYYRVHKNEINSEGIIQTFLDEDKAKNSKKPWKKKTKKQLHEEKVARLRKNDKLDEEALEKKLSNELEVKKAKIRKDQERDLFN